MATKTDIIVAGERIADVARRHRGVSPQDIIEANRDKVKQIEVGLNRGNYYFEANTQLKIPDPRAWDIGIRNWNPGRYFPPVRREGNVNRFEPGEEVGLPPSRVGWSILDYTDYISPGRGYRVNPDGRATLGVAGLRGTVVGTHYMCGIATVRLPWQTVTGVNEHGMPREIEIPHQYVEMSVSELTRNPGEGLPAYHPIIEEDKVEEQQRPRDFLWRLRSARR